MLLTGNKKCDAPDNHNKDINNTDYSGVGDMIPICLFFSSSEVKIKKKKYIFHFTKSNMIICMTNFFLFFFCLLNFDCLQFNIPVNYAEMVS